MGRTTCKGAMFASLVLAWCLGSPLSMAAWAQAVSPSAVPAAPTESVVEFPKWPKPLPNEWVLGPIAAVATDGLDHLWVLHSPLRTESAAMTVPPVIEFNADGDVVQAWGGPGKGYEWPVQTQAISVDSAGHVWIRGSGSGGGDAGVLAFTRNGTFVLRMGLQGPGGGPGPESAGRAVAPGVASFQPAPRHSMAVDSKGSIYTTEVGGRLRKFAYTGLGEGHASSKVFDPSKPRTFDAVDNECRW